MGGRHWSTGTDLLSLARYVVKDSREEIDLQPALTIRSTILKSHSGLQDHHTKRHHAKADPNVPLLNPMTVK